MTGCNLLAIRFSKNTGSILHNVTTVFKQGNPLDVGKNQNKTEKTVSDIVQMSLYFVVVYQQRRSILSVHALSYSGNEPVRGS